jgi:hypothetical protein
MPADVIRRIAQTQSARVVLATATLLVALVLAGYLLPQAWRVERQIFIAAPPAAIFPWINSLRRWPSWTGWPDAAPGLTVEYSGPDSGAGATRRWKDDRHRAALKIMQSRADRLVEYELLFDAGESVIEGVLRLDPVQGGTRVTWGIGSHVGANPLRRYDALLTRIATGKAVEEMLVRLGEQTEKPEK